MTASGTLAPEPVAAGRPGVDPTGPVAIPRAQWAARPPRVPLAKVFLVCGLVLAVEIPLMLAFGRSWQQSLLPGYLILTAAFGAVFCLGAVTAAGFVAGAAGAGLVALDATDLPPVLGGAVVLALLCGLSPGWSRVEAWQAARDQPLTAGEEAAVARRPLSAVVGRHRVDGPRIRRTWRADRVLAAFLVLAFPPSIAAFSEWFVTAVVSR